MNQNMSPNMDMDMDFAFAWIPLSKRNPSSKLSHHRFLASRLSILWGADQQNIILFLT